MEPPRHGPHLTHNLPRSPIKYIANKNVKQIPGWMDKNPDSKNTQTKLHDKYMRMLCFSMGAKTEEEDQEYYKKIIRNVAKEVCIDKAR